jgi:hypothetical protein
MSFRRLVYVSRAVGEKGSDELPAILRQSQANNGLNGVSGVLWVGARRYLQVLEGTPGGVGEVFGKIACDPRHEQVRIVSDTEQPERQFGGWTMAGLSMGAGNPVVRERLLRILVELPADVGEEFQVLVAA